MPKKKSRPQKVARALASAADTIPLAPPGGMRDLLPPYAEQRAQLRRQLMQTFLAHGYQRVTTPPFEYADLVERGYDAIDRRDLVRFVLADTGDVAVLRPDITPQIARIVATRLNDRPAPWRVCYEGTVIRRRRGRARRQQQISQVGIELIGANSARSDAEVIALGARACQSTGLRNFRIELAQTKLGLSALESIAPELRESVIDLLSRKDTHALGRLLQDNKVGRNERDLLLKLTELYGDVKVVDQARRALRSAQSRAALDELSRVISTVQELGFSEELLVDLGSLRGHAYYTGVSAALLAAGPGESIGMGGRYDQLLARYGLPEPATGFAIDVDNLEWALSEQKGFVAPARTLNVLVGGAAFSAMSKSADALRTAGFSTTTTEARDVKAARGYASAWQFDAVLWLSKKTSSLIRVRDGKSLTLNALDTNQLEPCKAWLRG